MPFFNIAKKMHENFFFVFRKYWPSSFSFPFQDVLKKSVEEEIKNCFLKIPCPIKKMHYLCRGFGIKISLKQIEIPLEFFSVILILAQDSAILTLPPVQ
jgi:hypothetical protein